MEVWLSPKLHRVYVLLVVLLPALAYWRGLSHGFVADDFSRLENAMVGPTGWLQFLAYSFRPFQILIHVLQYKLFGLKPLPLHLVNLIVHIACSVLVFHLTWMLTSSSPKALIAGLVFGLFPRHHTSVLWMISNICPFMALFYLLACLAFWRFLRTRHWTWYLLTAVSLVLALANYEQAATLPVVLFLAEVMLCSKMASVASLVKRLFQPSRYLKYIPLVIVVVGWRLLGVAVARMIAQVPDLDLIPHDYGYQGIGFHTVSSFVTYMVYQLYPQIPLRLLDVNTGTALLALASLGLLGLLFWKGSSLERFLWLALGIQFVPMVLFQPFGNDDRHFYLPSVGYAIILSILLFRLREFLRPPQC